LIGLPPLGGSGYPNEQVGQDFSTEVTRKCNKEVQDFAFKREQPNPRNWQ
jgi:hypothetical protein